MKNFRSLSLIFLPFFFFLLSSSNSMSLFHPSFRPFYTVRNQSQKLCLDDQRFALLQLQQDLYCDPYFLDCSKARLMKWDVNNTDCCSWDGVKCDDVGHVIGLDLSFNGLSGSFHSIFELHHLQSLNLAGNSFNTTLFQYEFDRLPNLTHLDLSNSFFHGQIPLGISYLTRLEFLDLSNKVFPWLLIPHPIKLFHDPSLKLGKPNLKALIQNMTSLKELYLDGVDISSDSNKWCETIAISLPKLRVLSMSDCGLPGPFCSSLLKLHFLSDLNLDGNSISYLPPNFSEISPNLVSLSLEYCNLSGHFPTEVFSFPNIQYIDISFNELTGQLPEFFFNSSLQFLILRGTNFNGKLPESIGNLNSSLQFLSLWGTNFNGKLPESIGNLKLLAWLDLSYNHFDGPIPKSLFQLPRLQYLSIGHNSFGSLNLDIFLQLKHLTYLDLSNVSLSIESTNLTFPKLESLCLSSCNLSEFPEFIKTQDKLVNLDLSNNYIHGFVPKWLWRPTLNFLNLSFNANIDFPKQFPFGDANSSFLMLKWLELKHCNLSRFPEFLESQEELGILDLSYNRISGTVPNWVWKRNLTFLDFSNNHLSSLDQFSSNHSQTSSHLSTCKLTQLLGFFASDNNLSGLIPNCLGKISTLQALDLQRNNFTGILPNFTKATGLRFLEVGENRLEGKLPRSLAKCTDLQVLDVRHNRMQDTFPFWLEKLPELKVLVLQGNRFYGPIKFRHENPFPALDVLDIASNEFFGVLSSIDFLQATQLRSIKMGWNKLEGKLPRSLANFTKLEVLDVGHNMIHDTFPFWLEKLPSLKVLILRGNRFFGTIKTINVFPMLRILDIASNNFSGELSTKFLEDLRAMMMITVGSKNKPDYIGDEVYYQDSMTIVNKGIELFYDKVLTLLTCLDLSSNSFHGRIPEEIQNLKSLMVLNLSRNSFSGRIPLALENLKKLESLDLSNNKLSGKIPPQLTSLTFLEALNLSYNQLEGSIPQSYQFSTFLNDSYRGNSKLCGPPLTRKCNEVGVAMQPQRDDVGHSWVNVLSIWKIALIGYGSGIAVGFFLGYTVLNELGNKWVDRFTRNGKRNRRRRR